MSDSKHDVNVHRNHKAYSGLGNLEGGGGGGYGDEGRGG